MSETFVGKLYTPASVLGLEFAQPTNNVDYQAFSTKIAFGSNWSLGTREQDENGRTAMKKKLALVAAAVMFTLTGTVTAAPVILYDNLGATSSGADPIQTGAWGPLYDSFSTDGSAVELTDLQLLLSAANVVDGGSVSVGLYSDSSTAPGALITSLGTILDSALSSSLGVIDLSGLSANLSANTRYWIGLSSSQSSADWSWSLDISGTGVSSEFYANFGLTSNVRVFPNSGGPYQMELTASTVPEPATLALLGLGLAGLAASRRRKQ